MEDIKVEGCEFCSGSIRMENDVEIQECKELESNDHDEGADDIKVYLAAYKYRDDVERDWSMWVNVKETADFSEPNIKYASLKVGMHSYEFDLLTDDFRDIYEASSFYTIKYCPICGRKLA